MLHLFLIFQIFVVFFIYVFLDKISGYVGWKIQMYYNVNVDYQQKNNSLIYSLF